MPRLPLTCTSHCRLSMDILPEFPFFSSFGYSCSCVSYLFLKCWCVLCYCLPLVRNELSLQARMKGNKESRSVETCGARNSFQTPTDQTEEVYKKPIKTSFLAKHPEFKFWLHHYPCNLGKMLNFSVSSFHI